MTEVAPQVVPIFATPFALASVPGADALNPALASLLSQRATPERADMANQQARTYQSRPNLFDWTEEPVSWIRAGLIDLVSGFARSINEFSDEQFAGLFSITKKSLVDGLAAEKGPFTKTATKVIAGQEAVGVTATDSTLYVSTKDARPLETEPLSGSTSSGKVTFTEYDAVPEPTPPPAEQTIDSSKLGG